MQIQNWDDLRYLLALSRGGSIAGAAKLLRVNETTVSRRIGKLASTVQAPLIHRTPDNRVVLTDVAESIVAMAENAEHQIDLIEQSLSTDNAMCRGTVRLTSVPIVVNQVLIPHLPALVETYPFLELELITDSRNLSLTRREADIAIRLARPTTGGNQIKIRKLGALTCSVYRLNELTDRQTAALPWLTYDDSLAHIPPQQWMQASALSNGESVSTIKVHDAESALAAVLCGLGKAVLPDIVAATESRLQRVHTQLNTNPPARDLWMLSHSNQRAVQRIRVVIEWLESVVATTSCQ
ncbi:MAG: LysR family transcriptional regulator [Pseudomonadota bacterium]